MKVKARVQWREERDWLEGMRTKPKLRTYVKLKTKLRREPYLTAHKIRRKKTLMTEIRGGTNELEIEVGRREGKRVEERVCRVCGDGKEDERHFVIDCIRYWKERQDLALALQYADTGAPADKDDLFLYILDADKFRKPAAAIAVTLDFLDNIRRKRKALLDNS